MSHNIILTKIRDFEQMGITAYTRSAGYYVISPLVIRCDILYEETVNCTVYQSC